MAMKYTPIDLAYELFTDFDGTANYELKLTDNTLTTATLRIPYRKSPTSDKPVKTEYEVLGESHQHSVLLLDTNCKLSSVYTIHSIRRMS